MTAKVYCDDWSCPARVSCAHHFGRSAAYAGMREGAKVESVVRTGDYKRGPGKDSCGEYRLDRPKDWLMPQPGEVTIWPDEAALWRWATPAFAPAERS